MGSLHLDMQPAALAAKYKSGSRAQEQDCRPVSPTSVLDNSLEKLAKWRICMHLMDHLVIFRAPRELRKGKLWSSNKLSFWDGVSARRGQEKVVGVCYQDTNEDYEPVCHRLLPSDMQVFEMFGRGSKWAMEFLGNSNLYLSR